MSAALALRPDFDAADLRRLAKASTDAAQTRRLLALAVIYDGSSRIEAARSDVVASLPSVSANLIAVTGRVALGCLARHGRDEAERERRERQRGEGDREDQ